MNTTEANTPAATTAITTGTLTNDLFTLLGVRKMLGDPDGKLAQIEIVDRIGKLVRILQETVGLADAMKMLSETARNRQNKVTTYACYEHIMEVVTEEMPEYDEVLKAIWMANPAMEPIKG